MKSKPPVASEHTEQVALMQWAARKPELEWLFAIPNGGTRTKTGAVKLKREGVKGGPADLCLPLRRDPWPGLWVEMKRTNATPCALQAEQRAFAKHVIEQGYAWCCAKGWAEAKELIEAYLAGEWDQVSQSARWKVEAVKNG